MKKLFHKIYWNKANLTGVSAYAVAETYAFVPVRPMCLCTQTSMFGNEELRPFLTKADFDFHLNHRYWFKAKIDEKIKQNANYHKINI